MIEEIKDGLHIDPDGAKYWFHNNKPHRLDGPAVVYSDGDTCWYKNGLRHRIGGPAYKGYNGDEFWYLYGYLYDEDDYNHSISNLPLLYWNRFKKGEWV
jgi:hypothetical protein